MKEEKRTFKKDKATQNKIRFREDSSKQPEISGFIYLQKWFVEDADEVEVTVKVRGGDST